jgi:4-aminobutyrate aminotransferase-like enzyme
VGSDDASKGRSDVPRIVATPPGPRTREILERQRSVLYRGLAEEVGPFVICRKAGDEIEDVDGNVYLDFISAMASVPVGAAHADITEAAVEALRRYGNEDTHYYSHEFVLPLAERLVAIAPGALSRVDIALNGTEAVETCVRFMRRATGRPIVIGFMGGYHGEAGTAGAIGA